MTSWVLVLTVTEEPLLEARLQEFFFFFLSFFGLFFVVVVVVVVAISWAAPAAYGGSQARGRIRAVAAGLCHSHSNARSKTCLRPTPQLTATLDP